MYVKVDVQDYQLKLQNEISYKKKKRKKGRVGLKSKLLLVHVCPRR
jgi:hypothetical protein